MVPRPRTEGAAAIAAAYPSAVLGFVRNLYRVGGMYSVVVDDRGFAVVRLIARRWWTLYVRVYSNRYRERPSDVDRSSLFIRAERDFAALDLNATLPEERPDPGPWAIELVPVSSSSFAQWRPQLITVVKVDDEEIEARRRWRSSLGRP